MLTDSRPWGIGYRVQVSRLWRIPIGPGPAPGQNVTVLTRFWRPGLVYPGVWEGGVLPGGPCPRSIWPVGVHVSASLVPNHPCFTSRVIYTGYYPSPPPWVHPSRHLPPRRCSSAVLTLTSTLSGCSSKLHLVDHRLTVSRSPRVTVSRSPRVTVSRSPRQLIHASAITGLRLIQALG